MMTALNTLLRPEIERHLNVYLTLAQRGRNGRFKKKVNDIIIITSTILCLIE